VGEKQGQQAGQDGGKVDDSDCLSLLHTESGQAVGEMVLASGGRGETAADPGVDDQGDVEQRDRQDDDGNHPAGSRGEVPESQHDGQGRDQESDQQRSRITHEDGSRSPVPEEESDIGSDQAGGEYGQEELALHQRQDQEKTGDDGGHPGAQSIFLFPPMPGFAWIRRKTHARVRMDPSESGDPDADWDRKTKRGERSDGTLWEKVSKWFGYKLHLLIDSHYELPLAWKLTKASRSDTVELVPLVKDLKKSHPERIEVAKDLSADKGYDSEQNNAFRPLIDIRSMWKTEDTRLLDGGKADNVVYDESGRLYCHFPVSGESREMAFQEFEKDRGCLKYRCPAAVYDFECRGRSQCGNGSFRTYGRIVRVSLETDRRIFTPIARSSYAWARGYAGEQPIGPGFSV